MAALRFGSPLLTPIRCRTSEREAPRLSKRILRWIRLVGLIAASFVVAVYLEQG